MSSNPPSKPQVGATLGPAGRNRQSQGYSSGALDQATVIHLIKAEVAISEARMNVELGKLEATISRAEFQRASDNKSLSDKVDSVAETLPKTTTLVFTIIGTGASAVIAILGILAFAGDRFDGGMAASGALQQQASEQAATVAKISASIDDLKAQVHNADKPQASPRDRQSGTVHHGTEPSVEGRRRSP
jgi:hypothetical protein